MYLKRLDVAGFKSFPARTSFEFGQGITAIVGPNGSGKSNIADALRWVLGEQSGRLLRARKLEEVIFAGSSQRPAADKAEITLTLDNSDGWLPLDFAEVAITRRAYRSGESEYRINGKHVRLRDLQHLLLQAKTGQSSYAIIGQGLVETVLNLRPEERRQLIEEAADIQRYRLKIEEAQGKLAATRENMERAKLLIKEIAPRLSSLERQAQRAQEHARFSRELGQALRAWYDHHWQRAVEALAAARASHDQAQAEETQARLAVETCQRELQSLMQELEERRTAAAASLAERDRLVARLRELEQKLALARQRRVLLEARQRDLREETQALEEERGRAEAAIRAHQGRRAAIEGELMAARQTLLEKRAELADLEGELGGLTGQSVGTEEKAARHQAAAADLKARVQRIAASRDNMAKELSRLETQRRSLISQMAEAVRVLRGMRGQEAAAAAEVLQTAQGRPNLEAELQRLRGSLAPLEAKQQARRARLEGLRSRLQVLQEVQERYRQAARQAEPEPELNIEGFVAAVYQILRVPRSLERAFEAALADYAEGVIVHHQKEAILAAQAIAQQGLSRTHILPLDSIKAMYPLNILKERGVLGVASKLAKCEARFQRLVDALLGRIIVVEDVEAAQRVLRRGMGSVVTLHGVVFHPLGAVSAGFPRARQPQILSQEWDLEAIPKEMARVQRSLELTEGQIERLRQQERELQARLSGLTQETEAAHGRRLRFQETLGQRQQRLAHLKGQLRGLVAAQEPIRQEAEALDRESQRLQEEREHLLAEAQAGQETARYLRQAGQVIQQRRDALLGAANAASSQVAQLEGELQALVSLSRASEADLARLSGQLSAREAQLQSLAAETASLDQDLGPSERELARAQQQSRAYLDARQPGQEDMASLETRQRELHPQLLHNQNRLLQAERHLLETEAEVRRWEMELAALRQRIEEDGLAISDQGEVIAPQGAVARIPYWLAASAEGGSASGGDSDEGRSGNIRPISGGADIDPQALGQQIDRLRARIRQLGPVNVEAQADYRELKERHDFLSGQLADLQEADKALLRAIGELNKVMGRRFQVTFAQVAEGFSGYFQQFFGGGHAELALSGDGLEAGVEIVARPPGKRVQSLNQLSGGEKALTAVALLFALLQANPSPFCVLDEVDAMLDEANVGRFVTALQELSGRTQFIVITHARRTIEVSDSIYGVSMGPDSASRVLSLRLADVAAG